MAAASGVAAEAAGVSPAGTADEAVPASPAVTGTSMSAGDAARPVSADTEPCGPLLADRDGLAVDPVGVIAPDPAARSGMRAGRRAACPHPFLESTGAHR
jgi:hypothetical protein